MNHDTLRELSSEGEELMKLAKLGLIKGTDLNQYKEKIRLTLVNNKEGLSTVSNRMVEKAFTTNLPFLSGFIESFSAMTTIAELTYLIESIQENEGDMHEVELPDIDIPDIGHRSEVLKASLDEAKRNIKDGYPERSIDRLHTALHEYLKFYCKYFNIEVSGDINDPARILSIIRDSKTIVFSNESEKIFGSLIGIMGTLNTVRNNKSLAHANNLPAQNEAALYSDTIVVIIRWLDSYIINKE